MSGTWNYMHMNCRDRTKRTPSSLCGVEPKNHAFDMFFTSSKVIKTNSDMFQEERGFHRVNIFEKLGTLWVRHPLLESVVCARYSLIVLTGVTCRYCRITCMSADRIGMCTSDGKEVCALHLLHEFAVHMCKLVLVYRMHRFMYIRLAVY